MRMSTMIRLPIAVQQVYSQYSIYYSNYYHIYLINLLIKMMSKWSLKNLTPRQKFVLFSATFILITTILIIIELTSLSITGSTFMVWSQLQTTAMIQYLYDQYKMFFVGMQLIIAFDAIVIAFSLGFMYSVFHLSTMGNKIIMGVVGSILIVRWVSGLVFLLSAPALQDMLKNQFNFMNLDNNYQLYCNEQQCSIETSNIFDLNYVQCQKIKMWNLLRSYQIAYLVISIFLSVGIQMMGYWVNLKDVIRHENTDEKQLQISEL